MGVNIMEVLREQKLTRLKRSIASAETHERKVANQASATCALLNGNPLGDGTHLEEYKLRDCFIRELEAYTRKPRHGYAHQPFNARGLALWKRVAKCWKTSGVTPEAFIKAQFTYFHKSFGRAPTLKDLTTDGAVVRAASAKIETVRSNDIAADINLGELFKHCEKHMADLMRAQRLSREDVYRRLVMSGLVMFPEKFLAADPTWRKVKCGNP